MTKQELTRMADDRQAPVRHPGELLFCHEVLSYPEDPRCQRSPSVLEPSRHLRCDITVARVKVLCESSVPCLTYASSGHLEAA